MHLGIFWMASLERIYIYIYIYIYVYLFCEKLHIDFIVVRGMVARGLFFLKFQYSFLLSYLAGSVW
jgi:hypothetical protein